MAEIIQHNNSKNKSTNRKQLSTRVDLTPMVDLGFLLITFFIFTTSMSKPVTMKMNLPIEDFSNPTKISKNKLITLMPVSNNKVKYYFEELSSKIFETNFSEQGLRKVLQTTQREVQSIYNNKNEMVVLIKPTDSSTYQNLVDILDEMAINQITRYMLLQVSEDEKKILKK